MGNDYTRVHRELNSTLGRATDYSCAICGKEPADHWAYDHLDPDGLVAVDGKVYSEDMAHYKPLCASCHRRLDYQYEKHHVAQRTYRSLDVERWVGVLPESPYEQ